MAIIQLNGREKGWPRGVSAVFSHVLGAALFVGSLSSGASREHTAQAQAPTVLEIAAKIDEAYSQLPGLHLKWTVANVALVGAKDHNLVRLASLNLTDEFAIRGDQRYRHTVTPFFDKPSQTREEWFTFVDGETRWHGKDFDPRKPDVGSYGNLYITRHNALNAENLNLAAHYLEYIGSPYYEGKKLEVWRILRSCKRLKEAELGDLRPFSIVPALTSGAYTIRPQQETIEGSSCWVVESPGSDAMWLDPSRGFAVVRREWSWPDDGSLMCRYVNSDFMEVAPGFWLPKSAQRQLMVYPGDPLLPKGKTHVLSTATLTSAVVGPLSDALFEYTPPDGTYVLDDTHFAPRGESVNLLYKWGSTPEATNAAIDKSIDEWKMRHHYGGRMPTPVRWLVLAVNVVIVIFIAALIVRRRRLQHG